MSESPWFKLLGLLCLLALLGHHQAALALTPSCSDQVVGIDPSEFCGSVPPMKLLSESCCDEVCQCDSKICGGEFVAVQPAVLAHSNQPRALRTEPARVTSAPPAQPVTYPPERPEEPPEHSPEPPERPPQTSLSRA